jgi:hypothetical protein
MARYSFAVYGTPGLKYGQIENNRAYYNVSLRAVSLNYRTVSLYWTSVLTDPDDPAPSHWMVVRNYQGASDNPYQGTIIDSGTISSYRLSAVDLDVDATAQITYSFWLFNGSFWINCGNSTTTSVSEDFTPTLIKMEKWIPSAWLNASLNSGDSVGEPETNDLTNVLSAYAFAYDELRARAELLEKSSEYSFTPVQLLKSKIEDRGFSYEPTLGDIYHRGVYRVSELVNTKKGTTEAIISYTTALTHWGTTVTAGKNLMLDYNDSSFEESIGRWSATTGTLTQRLYANSLADLGVTVTPPTVSYKNPNPYFAPRQLGYMTLSGAAAASNTLLLPSDSSSKILYGIPVKPLTTYLFRGQSRVGATANGGTVKAKIHWYDRDGVLISSTAYGSTVTLTQSFQWFYAPSTNGAASPATAVYAAIEIVGTTATTSTRILFDMFEFTEAANTQYYEDARKVIVAVAGDKTNYLPNPSFETNTNTWLALNGTFATSTTPSAAVIKGTKAGKFTVTSPGIAGVASDWIPVDAAENYVFSAYVTSNTTKNVIARLEFSSLQSVEEQTTILSDDDGLYYPVGDYTLDSDPLALTNAAQRISVAAVSPTYSVDAGYPSAKVWLYLEDAEVGDILYVDGAFLEDGVEPSTYFDGSGATVPTDPINNEFIVAADCIWENAATSSGRSYRWTNYLNKIARLAETLPLVMPYGSSWEILPGFSTPDYPELTPSILLAPSFEQGIAGWITDASVLEREVTRGSLFDEYTTHGAAFGHITSTAASAFGVHTDKLPIDFLAGYYISAAIKPENEDAYGEYEIKARFYDEADVLIIEKSYTARIVHYDRWAYFAVYAPKSEISGAATAQLFVEATPDSLGAGRVFYLDRVVFRQ